MWRQSTEAEGQQMGFFMGTVWAVYPMTDGDGKALFMTYDRTGIKGYNKQG